MNGGLKLKQDNWGYLPTWMVHFDGINVGTYTVRPIDPMGSFWLAGCVLEPYKGWVHSHIRRCKPVSCEAVGPTNGGSYWISWGENDVSRNLFVAVWKSLSSWALSSSIRSGDFVCVEIMFNWTRNVQPLMGACFGSLNLLDSFSVI